MAIKHIPLRAPRTGMAEAVFVAEWQRWNPRETQLLGRLLGRKRPSQRDAQVAASFVSWLGTNVGSSYLHQARQRLALGSEDFAEAAYLTAWALTNRRKLDGLRVVEFILAKDQDINKGLSLWEMNNHKVLRSDMADVTLRDLDVIESIVSWLATSEGAMFIETCCALDVAEANRRRQVFALEQNQ